MVSVESAKQQLVAGVLYTIKGTFSSASSPELVCTLRIWERKWLGTKEITVEYDIDNRNNKFEFVITTPKPENKERKKRQIPGGVSDVSIDNEEVVQQLNKAVASIAGSSESSNGQFT